MPGIQERMRPESLNNLLVRSFDDGNQEDQHSQHQLRTLCHDD